MRSGFRDCIQNPTDPDPARKCVGKSLLNHRSIRDRIGKWKSDFDSAYGQLTQFPQKQCR